MQFCLRRVSEFEFGGFGLLWVLRGISEEWSGWCVCVGGLVGVESSGVFEAQISRYWILIWQRSRHGVEKVL